jgi:hypothetical protein
MSNRIRISGEPDKLAKEISPLIQLEIASIGAIESASPREQDPGYVMLFHETKTGKQANVEQMNTLLRMAGRPQVESGGVAEPLLHLQTLTLQRTNTTALLGAMRILEETLTARYRETLPRLKGFERNAMNHVLNRTTKHWMVLVAHVAQRKEGNSDHADILPLPLSSYFATEEDRVCMRCLFDRPGERMAIQKPDPYTYLCAACHDEVVEEFPPDLQAQMQRWTEQAHRDRVLEKAFGRPSKLAAIKEVHAVLAGLPPEVPPPAILKPDASSGERGGRRRHRMDEAPSDLMLDSDGIAADELAYTDLLFDFRSVRRSW